MTNRATIPLALALLMTTSCALGTGPPSPPAGAPSATSKGANARSTPVDPAASGTGERSLDPDEVRREDPRGDGLDIALGEWVISAEAETIRPGRMTFVVANRGTVPHGFEIEGEEGDSSGPGSGDGLKVESRLLRPGQTTRLSVELPVGVYEFECIVDGHDDLGMEGSLRVRRSAALVAPEIVDREGSTEVRIQDFAFSLDAIEVPVGSKLTWSNGDATEHTVTAEGGAFDSGPISPGSTFGFRMREEGTFGYRCLIHPDMRGTVDVG